MAAVYREVLQDGRGAVVAPEDAPDAEEVADRIREDRTATVLALELDGQIVGEGVVTRFTPRWLAHVGVLSLHVAPGHQGRGLGRVLLAGLLERARTLGFSSGGPTPVLERVELYVRADNDRAIGLYRSAGFVTEGARRAFVRPAGRPAVDDLVMARFFHPPRREEVFAVVVRPDRLATWSAPLRVGESAEAVARGLVADRRVAHVATLPPWDEPLAACEASGLPALVRRHAAVFAGDPDDRGGGDDPPYELAVRIAPFRG